MRQRMRFFTAVVSEPQYNISYYMLMLIMKMKIKNICTKNKLALRKKVITKQGEIKW